ncbi:hypothetical protein KI614_05515 [Dechloromonas denitrificans]|jgi:hypothetical protein|uniref:hypothetical protein n=1 Tax=Dechloromonas denitrificans TaxID=281362 RepID=UPI001CF8F2C4|nr:hypothetical protein [Dechloromonas denitrificans]UCV12670.1 hypothetical protein KI614_05515 [Dechloromonas denitrificans]
MRIIDIQRIEREARALRAQEIQRLQGLFAERLSLYAVLMGHSLLALATSIGEIIRPAFSWNPQADVRRPRIALSKRLNRRLRALFAWNPRRGAC